MKAEVWVETPTSQGSNVSKARDASRWTIRTPSDQLQRIQLQIVVASEDGDMECSALLKERCPMNENPANEFESAYVRRCGRERAARRAGWLASRQLRIALAVAGTAFGLGDATARAGGSGGGTPSAEGTRTVSSSKHTMLPLHGSNGGTPFEYTCASNSVLSKFSGREGSVIDSLKVECREMLSIGLPGDVASTSPTYGGSGGSPFEGGCTGGTMINGIHGNSGSVIDGLGIVCSTYVDVMDGEATERLPSEADWGGFADGLGQQFWTDVCPPGYVGTGIKGRVGTVIDSISLRCSKVERSNYDSGCVLDDDVTYSLPMRGGRSCSFGNCGIRGFTCPDGAVLTRVTGRSGSVVDQVRFQCRTLDVCAGGVGAIVETSPVYGGGGGSPFDGECAGDAVVAGFYGRAGSVIDRLGLYCATPSDFLFGNSGITMGPWGGEVATSSMTCVRRATSRTAFGIEMAACSIRSA